jgi:hypothetical protein
VWRTGVFAVVGVALLGLSVSPFINSWRQSHEKCEPPPGGHCFVVNLGEHYSARQYLIAGLVLATVGLLLLLAAARLWRRVASR